MDGMVLKMKRNQLTTLMREVGRLFGEQVPWMETYIDEVVNKCSTSDSELNLALACFRDVKQYGLKLKNDGESYT